MKYIIDCHAHIYPDKIAEKASKNIGGFYSLPMSYDGTESQLIQICKDNNIKKCVINSVATVPAQVRSINNFIAERVSSSSGLFIGLCTLHQDMSASEIADELNEAEKQGLSGIKLHPDFQKFSLDDKMLYKIYEAAESRFPILFHTGDRRFKYSNPERLTKVLDDFPNLTAIAAHFGGWSEWDEAVRCLSKYERLYVDTSSSFYTLSAERSREVIKAFDSEHILFGTDYPMWDAGKELEFLNKLELDEKLLENILWGNAARLFGIDLV